MRDFLSLFKKVMKFITITYTPNSILIIVPYSWLRVSTIFPASQVIDIVSVHLFPSIITVTVQGSKAVHKCA